MLYKFDIASTFTTSKSIRVYLYSSGSKSAFKLQKAFTSLANQPPDKAKKLQLTSIQPREFEIKNIDKLFSPPPVWHARYTSLHRAKGTNIKSLDLFDQIYRIKEKKH